MKTKLFTAPIIAIALTIGFNHVAHSETKQRTQKIAKCLDAFKHVGNQKDTRTDTVSDYLSRVRYTKDGRYTAIKTAANSEKFENDLKKLSALSKDSGIHMLAFMKFQHRGCIKHLDYADVPQSAKDAFSRNFDHFITAEKEMLAIVKKLEAAGRDMIKNGTPPVPKDQFVPLFNLPQ